MLKFVFPLSPVLPAASRAASTSFISSLTAYSSVVLVSSTSSTIKMFFPISVAISRLERSSHCVRVTFVPGCSISLSLLIFPLASCFSGSSSYSERPMAWIGMLGEPSRLRKDLSESVGCDLPCASLVRPLPKNARGNVASAADGNDEIRLEVGEDAVG